MASRTVPLLLGLAAGLLGGGLSSFLADHLREPSQIRTSEVVLVDSEGYTRARLFMAQGAQISVSRDQDGVFHSEFETVARLEFLTKGGEITWSVPVGAHDRLLGAVSR